MVAVSGQAARQAWWSQAATHCLQTDLQLLLPLPQLLQQQQQVTRVSGQQDDDASSITAMLRRLLPSPAAAAAPGAKCQRVTPGIKPGPGVMSLLQHPAAVAKEATCPLVACSGQPAEDAECWQHWGAQPGEQLTQALQSCRTGCHHSCPLPEQCCCRRQHLQQICTTSIVVPAGHLQQWGTSSPAPCGLT